jgi:arsenical pump membrane protein
MVLVSILGGLTCVSMVLGILFFPQIKIKKFRIDTYWVIALVGALLLVITGGVSAKYLWQELTADSAINPLKILALFISMTVLSVFLDEVGFFKYLAVKTLKLAKHSQMKLFITLYVMVSVLTIFTSNDVIVLTFTPFICYFAKHAKINPLPYLVGEFVAANTTSMFLILGNPTNVYIATSYGITFIEYLKVMALPTVSASIVAFVMLYVCVKKKLAKPMDAEEETAVIENKAYFIIGIIFLACCTLALAIGSYINLEMWVVATVSAIGLITVVLTICVIQKKKPIEVEHTLKREPWQLVPFIISMFTIILAFKECGITAELGKLLGAEDTVLKYGVLSFLTANIINNIPMSVLFCTVVEGLSGLSLYRAVFATIIGSNIGAYLTPIGALAGIMWTNLLKKHRVKLRYRDFIKYGIIISVPTLFSALTCLALVL